MENYIVARVLSPGMRYHSVRRARYVVGEVGSLARPARNAAAQQA